MSEDKEKKNKRRKSKMETLTIVHGAFSKFRFNPPVAQYDSVCASDERMFPCCLAVYIGS